MIARDLDRGHTPISVRTVDLSNDPPSLDPPVVDRRPGRSMVALLRDGIVPVDAALLPLPNETIGDDDLRDAAAAHDSRSVDVDRVEASYDPTASVSVIICTVDPGDSLCRCLDAVLANRHVKTEIIVVNNRPMDDLACRRLRAILAERPRVLSVEEPRPGLGYARNAGLGIATGEIIAFTDDDVIPDADWLTAVVAAFNSSNGVDCVTGLIMPTELETDAQLLLEKFGGFAKGFERVIHSKESAGGDPLFPYAAGRVGSGANMAVTRDCVAKLAGFDDEFGTGTPALAGEDLDLFLRVLASGGKIVYEPAALVWHEHPRSMEQLRRTVFAYGASLTAVLFKRLLFQRGRLHLVRRIPSGVKYALSTDSAKNASRREDYPRALILRELAGMIYGPVAYLRSRRLASLMRPRRPLPAVRTRRARPIAVGEIELSREIVDFLPGLTAENEQYAAARLLARLDGSPVGFIELELSDGIAHANEIKTAAYERFGNLIRERQSRAVAGGEVVRSIGAQPEHSVSVVICTCNRPRHLLRAIESILANSHDEFELIVVDNAPGSSETRNIVDEIHDSRLRYVAEPVPGLARARNCGIKHASGSVIAFTDDDVVADRDWIAMLLRGFSRSWEVGCVTGIVPPAELDTTSQQLFDRKVGWSRQFNHRIFGLEPTDSDHPLYPYKAGVFGTGANFALRRTAIDAIGGFDEALGAGAPPQSGEDFDIFVRTLTADWKISYEPDAITWHYHRREYSALASQIRSYGSGLTAYAVKHLLNPRQTREILFKTARAFSTIRQEGMTGSAGDAELKRAETIGMLEGPFLYIRGRLQLRARAPS